MKQTLTDSFIRNYSIPEKRTEIYDTVVTGLTLRITKTGYKSFALRYWYDEKSKQLTIGKYPDFTLAQAREKAKELKRIVSDGIDPAAQKKKRQEKKKREKSFSDLAEAFKAIHLKPLREKTREEHKRIVDNELIPAFGKIPAKDLAKSEIIAFLDDKAIKQGKPTMANRIRARLHSIYEFGIHRGIVDVNPVTSIKRYPEGETKRERYYSEKEIRHLWKGFEQQDEPAQSVMKMLLITGQRKTETMKMRWSDIDKNVWTIPAELAKGKRSHDIPLSDSALQVIDKMKSIHWQSDYVFNSPVLENSPVNSIKRSVTNVKQFTDNDFTVEDFRLHDLRRTAATFMAKLNVDRTTLGKILNHKGLAGDGQVTAIYDRHSYMKEKRTALNKWSQHLQRILTGESAKVLNM